MKRKTEVFLLLLAAGVTALLYMIVFRPNGRMFVLFSLNDQFWLPALGALLAVLIGGMLLCRYRRRNAAGRKSGFLAFVIGLMLVLGILQAALVIWRLTDSPDCCRLTKIPSPDGQHCIFRYCRTDMLGNSCYVFVYRTGAFMYSYLFDTDEENPQLVWDGEYVTFRGTAYHLAGDSIACS